LELPDGYEQLQSIINQEAQLIFSANKTALSPIMGVEIDYRVFDVPLQHQTHLAYYRTLKFAQTFPLSDTLFMQITQTIKASERLSNLQHHINEILKQFVGMDRTHQHTALIPSYKSLDSIIFENSLNPSIDDIAKVMNHDKDGILKDRLLHLDSSYDYDMKIIQTLINAKYMSAFKGYYTQIKERTMLYTTQPKMPTIQTKSIQTKSIDQRTQADIDPNLVATLNVMIEDALSFSTTIKNNSIDIQMITILKELRRIAQTKVLKSDDMAFLNALDLTMLNIIKIKDKPMVVKITNRLSEKLSAPKSEIKETLFYGGRYNPIEITIK